MTDTSLLDYFRSPEEIAEIEINRNSSAKPGFFRFGQEIVCYGQCAGAIPANEIVGQLPDTSSATGNIDGRIELPFDLTQLVANLRYERYALEPHASANGVSASNLSKRMYYFARPFLPVSLRRHLQRYYLSGWEKIAFPAWPVDFTADRLMERVFALAMQARGIKKVPFLWFWPNGVSSCVVMTHDVEHVAGRNFCDALMDLDDRFSIKSAFQIVPEVRYETRNGFLDKFRTRGFEINVHDLNHDGFLFRDKKEFSRRASQINWYAKDFGAEGFRSGAMYRNQDWFDAFEFSYDMSVPTVAHLEPQRGGCCTVMPYFIGKILELPLTMIQDYSLFHILGDYSIDLWKQQVQLIMERNGLISFITHPDYLIEKRAQAVYIDLLTYLAKLRDRRKVWFALPRDVNRWWRDRQQSRLVQTHGQWRIEGPASDRATIAYATLQGDRLAYSFEGDSSSASTPTS